MKFNINILVRVILYVVVAVGGLILFLPFFWMISVSLQTTTQLYRWPLELLPSPIYLRNYLVAWTSAPVARFYSNSIFVSFIGTGVSLIFCSLAGFSFAHYRFPARNLIFVLILSTLMLPVHVRIIPLFILMKNFGWLDTYQGLIVPGLANAFGIFLMRQFMKSIPEALFDAARIDGCSEFRIFAQIALPLSKPALATLGIFIFMTQWNDFFWPLLVVKSEEMKTLPLAIAALSQAQSGYVSTWPEVMSMAIIITIPTILVAILFQQYFKKGLTLTGLKM